MAQAGFRNRGMVEQIRAHHYLMDHLIQRLQATGIVDERQRSGRPRRATPSE